MIMIFECKDVTLGYENKVVAKNLNFKIDQGDYLCVVGENGTGKSTLIKTLLGLIKPLNGEVIANVQGKNHKGVGYLPQQTQAQKKNINKEKERSGKQKQARQADSKEPQQG